MRLANYVILIIISNILYLGCSSSSESWYEEAKARMKKGDLITAREAIEKALQALKDAHKAEDLAGIDAAMETLNTAWSAASEHMYAGNPQEGAATEGAANEKQDDNVADAEFEEVK